MLTWLKNVGWGKIIEEFKNNDIKFNSKCQIHNNAKKKIPLHKLRQTQLTTSRYNRNLKPTHIYHKPRYIYHRPTNRGMQLTNKYVRKQYKPFNKKIVTKDEKFHHEKKK